MRMEDLISKVTNQDQLLNRSERTDPESFFGTVHHVFDQAKNAAGGNVDRFYKIGDLVIRLCFAGDALVPYLTPALEHLSTEPTSTPSLTVCLWDSTSTKTVMPSPPWSAEDYLPRGQVRDYNNSRIRTAFHPGAYSLSMLNSTSNIGLFWIHDASKIPSYVTGSPLHVMLSWWAHLHGLELIHAAAVGTIDGGVLIVGKGGSGKSTTALSCLLAGFLYAGDDYVLVDARPVPSVYSLYNSAKLNRDQARCFPLMFSDRPLFQQSRVERTLTFLYETHPDQLATSLPLKAILIPRIAASVKTKLERASATDALAALAPSTLFQLPGEDQSTLRGLATLVAQVPNYILHLGTNFATIPAAVYEALARSKTGAAD